MERIFNFIKTNILLTALLAVVAVSVLFPRQFKKILGLSKPRRRRRPRRVATVTRRRTTTRSRKPLPRSVGMSKARVSGKGYAAAGGGYIPLKYNKDGSTKKAWQVGGTLAAKQRMSRLRKNK